MAHSRPRHAFGATLPPVRHLFDQLAKRLGKGALSPCGLTAVHDEIAPDAQHADLRHEPDPARSAERARLGLLGRLASVLCLLELFSSAPDEDPVLGCVASSLRSAKSVCSARGASAPAWRGAPRLR